MERIKKFAIPFITVILFSASFILIDPEWYYLRVPITIFSIAIFLAVCVGIAILGIIVSVVIMRGSIVKMKDHIVVKALRDKNKFDLWFMFPFTMIFEELLFRLYVFGFLYSIFGFTPAIFVGTIAFAIYHLHTWPSFHDTKITLAFVVNSGLLGFMLNLLVYYYGLLVCIIFHWAYVFFIFLYIANKIKNKDLIK